MSTMATASAEKKRQDKFTWARGDTYATYNNTLGQFIAQSCIECVPSGTVLDLACGDGELTRRFAAHYERVVGVDASTSHLATARASNCGAEFHESLVEDFHTEERFDGVFMVCLLEHVVDPAALLRKAASFLKHDGQLVVHVPNANALNRRIAVKMGSLASCEELSPFDIEVAGHRRSYTMASLRAEITRADLKLGETGGVFLKMMSTPQIDWFLQASQWNGNEFGWGRIGGPEDVDWREAYCRACYELGKENPEDTNVIYACATRGS